MWRSGDGDPTSDVEFTALAACLAEEAAWERPAFSSGFQAALMHRVRAEVPAGARRRQPRGLRSPPVAASCGGRRVSQSACGVALVIGSGVALVLAIGFPPGQVRRGGIESVAAGRLLENPLPLEFSGAEETSLIEQLPLFDDIDREVRSGVVMVASSLLDLPAWRDVADFDPGGFLGADPPP